MDLILENFHFLRPWLFLILLPTLVLLYQLKKQGSSLSAWQKICDPELLSYLKVGVETQTSKREFWLLFMVGILVVTALAGPVWKQLPQPMYREHSALVVLLDLSRSMDVADLNPSRLIRAKQKLTDLLKLRVEGQTALVVFAGTAFVVTPLTDDSETILSQLQSLTTDIMPKQGGNIDAALEKALLLFKQASVAKGQVLLLTDSDIYSQSVVKSLTDAGHRLTVIGVGTTSGAPINLAAGGFLTDNSGNIVIPQLKENLLRDLASLGYGSYHPLALDNRDIRALISPSETKLWSDKQKDETNIQTSDLWAEEGPWLLLLLIPVVLMGFRSGVLVITLFLCLPTTPVEAVEWLDLWQTKDQQGERLMQHQDYDQAASTFNNQAWKSAAAYRNQDYAAALKALESIKEPNADELYNKGNSLAQLGRMDEAIKSYAAALKLDKKHQDALANKELLEKLKQEQNKEDKQKSDEEKSDEQKSDEKKSDEEKSGEQKSDEQKSDEQKSDEQQSDQQKTDEQQEEKQPEVRKTKQELEEIEANQAFEQTLRRIPDDPGGLLRRKFKYQYKQQEEKRSSGEEQW